MGEFTRKVVLMIGENLNILSTKTIIFKISKIKKILLK